MVLTLAPYAWMVSSSFKPHTEIFSATLELIPRRPILDNYVVAVTREPTLRAIGNSLIMAGAETLAVVVTSVLTAYPFARLRFRGRDAVFLMVLGTDDDSRPGDHGPHVHPAPVARLDRHLPGAHRAADRDPDRASS